MRKSRTQPRLAVVSGSNIKTISSGMLTNNESSKVEAQLSSVRADFVADTDEDKTKEEDGQHGDGPEASSAGLHKEDGWDGADEQTATAC